MKKSHGFTLIELLAVIIVLAVIGLVATPIVLNVIEKAKEKANLNAVYGIMDAGRIYYTESAINPEKKDKIKNLKNIYPEIQLHGTKPEKGTLYVNENGLSAVAVVIGKNCYMKKFDGQMQINESDCDLGYIEKDEGKPTVTFEAKGEKGTENWYIDDLYLRVVVEDLESGPSRFKWCQGIDCEPNINESVINKTFIFSEDQKELEICVIGYDEYGNESEKKCSGIYQIDQTAPVFGPLTDLKINFQEEVDFLKEISVTDAMSGVVGDITYHPTVIDVNVVGETTVTYQAKDRAGNEATTERKVEVLGNAPTITYATTGSFNQSNWAREDFYVNAEVVDQSGKGIKSIKWCQTTGQSCEASQESAKVAVLISNESATNQVCVIAEDNNGKITNLCSPLYQLDKTAPVLQGIRDITIQKNETINLKENIQAEDTLSGIEGTFTYEPMSVDTSKAGTNIILYTVFDQAGNSVENSRKIIVDASAPTATFTVQGTPFNEFGWANNDFYIKVDMNDQSGLGIKEAKWCTTESNTCTPTKVVSGTSMTPVISSDGAHRICVQASDHNGKISEIICSDIYKLDKTVPTVPTSMNFVYANWSVYQENTWASIPVYVASIQSNPGPSGSNDTNGIWKYQISIDGTNWVDYGYTATGIYLLETNGSHTRYFRSVDYAGNVSGVMSRSAKIDRTPPTITAKSGEVSLTKGENIATDRYFDVTYSLSGGSVSCSPVDTSSLPVGNQTVTCTATSGSGLPATATKTIKITYQAYTLTNLLQNSSYENTTFWNLSLADYSTDYAYSGTKSLKLRPNVTSMTTATMPTPIDGHLYYGRLMYKTSPTFTSSDARFETYYTDAIGAQLVYVQKMSLRNNGWTLYSSIQKLPNTNYSGYNNWILRNFTVNANEASYMDDIMVIDLTVAFGTGNEPNNDWCDKNIPYFEGTKAIYK